MKYGFLKRKYIYLGLLILAVSLLFESSFSRPVISVSAADNSDVIAVRVMPNPDSSSPLQWYYNQGFSGSPKALTVDGYEAVRDGRTVFVNVGNAVWNASLNSGSGGYQLYTNIYLISYNQDAGPATKNILSKILKHWKFNLNLNDVETNGGAKSTCSANSNLTCLLDEECVGQGYCNSFKAQITRDVKRLAQIGEIKDSLENYKNQNGYYPILSSGSYIPNISISTWPSWRSSLGFPIDPVNKLIECSGYNATTCWNENNREFAWPNDLNNGTLPVGSYASIYKVAADGSSYNFYSFSESGLNINDKLSNLSGCQPMCYNKECGSNGCGGSCGTCDAGESCFQGTCYIGCNTQSGCQTSLANAYIIAGYCASGQCYQCLSGYTWDGTAQQCYKCLSGYIWTGSACEVPVTPCVSDGYCDGNCPVNCTVNEDVDCGGAGCQGDGDCDIVNECSVNGGDCDFNDCCGNGVCDAGVGEDVNNCSDDCGVAINPCIFSSGFFNLSCLFN